MSAASGACSAADALDVMMLESADKKLKKREYMRNIMRFYREEKRDELDALKAQVAALQSEYKSRLRASKRDLLLPWRQVAIALRDDLRDIQNERASLRAKAAALASLIRTSKGWVSTNLTSMHAITPTWRNVTLERDEQARELGKAWITKQMYHNTDRMFGQYAYPAVTSSDEFFDIGVDNTDVSFQYHHRRQYAVDVPMECVLDAYKRHLCAVLMMDWYGYQASPTLTEMSGNTTLHQLSADDDEWMNLVTGEFHDHDRCVFVVQQVQHDAANPTTQRQRNRMIWLDMRPIAGGRTLVRVLYRFDQYFDPWGFVPLEEEALSWGCDLQHVQDDQKESTFHAYCTNLLVTINANHQAKINAHLTTIMHASLE
ncbi:hypothetical protein DYB25_008829 [Aphanomyces astaci]|uniref:START domain-containing protein n=1 Tax=Aphanomyces astaci TaxID=112090 RepID=A0A397CAC1_APHAT|nr:hypothetical protein DYB25_008829 [Aphanomyces astaci]RHY42571.1 hypothetical protein DYB38_009397 [Aphanomyces astaci]RHY72227.1 hypothetical protein DYB34_009621 [Aphanomyces astaci]RHY93516.1 hypothetical protein DYB31_008146 [Aphanomyces astaci]